MFYSKDFTSWANHLLKRGKRRTISDIRRSVGDGQTLVHILEILGELNYSRYFFKNHCLSYYIICWSFIKTKPNKENIAFTIQSIDRLRSYGYLLQFFILRLRFDRSVLVHATTRHL